ncbi:MAG: NAD(P)-binding domain-containing protein, partial [Terriglobales bacterium]
MKIGTDVKSGTRAKATVFLGGGRITSALVAGLRLAKYDNRIVVHDRNPSKLRRLKKRYRVAVEPDLRRAVEQAELLIVAVRPDSVSDLLRAIGRFEIKKAGRPPTLVSLAAGIPLSRLRARLPSPARWARAMPSPVCRSGRGLTALAFDRSLPSHARRDVKSLFERVGGVLEIPESQFDVFTVTFSSSHGYHALAALAASAQRMGLSRETAITAAAHALADGIIYWRESRIPLARLLEEAATPGGTAAAVIQAMDSSGYQNSIHHGLRAGIA